MTRSRQLLLALTCLFGALLHILAPLSAQELNEAALVVDYGNGVVTYAVVPFSGDDVSGVELLRASGLSLVSIEFGGLGEGICSIEEHGCGVGDCRRLCQTSEPNSPFWQYFTLDDEQGWVFQPRGASSATVLPGQVDGWSWTGTEPDLPAVDFATVASLAGERDASSEPAATTYDAAGQILVDQESATAWFEYATAVALAVGVLALLVVATRRRPRASLR